jgi:hypothetical protein
MIKYILIFLIAASSLKAQWLQSTGIPANQLIYSLASCSGKMFAGTGVGILTTGGLSVSTDNGATWSNVDMNWSGQSAVMSLASKDNYIYAGTYEDDLFISSNAGVNWSHIVLNNSAGVFQVGVSGNNVIAYTNGTGPVWLSTNHGSNWSIVGSQALTGANDFLSLGSFFYTAGRNGMGFSTDNGLNWTLAANNGLPSNPDASKPLSGLVSHNGRIYGCCIQKILYTTDNGNNWVQTNIALSTFSTVYSMVSYGGRLYASLYGLNDTSRGVLNTSNNGANWLFMNQGFGTIPSIRRLLVNNEYILAGAYTGGVYRMPLSVLTGTVNENESVKDFSLKQNYPNPFNPETKISFSINKNEFTSLKVYDSMGRTVSVLVNEELKAGNYSFNFNGEKLSSGIYFYKLESGNFSDIKRMVLVK